MGEQAADHEPELVYEVRERVAVLTLNRPHVLNALNRSLRGELIEAVRRASSHDEVRVVVIQGNERAFCAGQDQNESAAMSAAQADDRITAYGELFDAVRRCEKPTIAKMDGYAAGAGLQLALHCDLRYCTSRAKLGMTELKVGSVCITGTQALATVVSEASLREFVLLGEFVGAERAFAMGLVTGVASAEALDHVVTKTALGLAEHPPLALALTKRFWRSRTQDDFEGAVAHAHLAHAANYASGDLSAAAEAFVKGRHVPR
ncbi:MAG: enoyl-CoA hydratase/isomerase family protein [Nocardioidaceae bacterium]